MKIVVDKSTHVIEKIEVEVKAHAIVPSWIGGSVCKKCHWDIDDTHCSVVNTSEGNRTYHTRCFDEMSLASTGGGESDREVL